MSRRMYMTSDDLIASVKRRASIPDGQNLITDEEILDFANEEMLMNLIPLITEKNEDYYLIRQLVPFESGTNRYEIPYRAIGGKLREVAYQNENGSIREMFRISTDDVTNDGYSVTSGVYRFYIEGEEVVLHTDPNNLPSGGLLMFYNLRPNALVDVDRIAVIQDIDRSTGVIRISATPDHFTSSLQYDFIKTKSPHQVLSFDISVTSVDSTTNTIIVPIASIPDKLKVGDRIAQSGETDLINAPSDVHVMLAQMVATRVLESIGDIQNLQAANDKLEKMEINTTPLLDNRVTGSPYKVKARNGFLRRSSLGRRFRKRTLKS